MSDSEPTKRGRPPGEDTPELLIRRELLAHLRIYRRLREIVEQRLADGQRIDPEELAKYMDLIRKGIVEMAKPIIPVAKQDSVSKEPEENAEAILAKLIGG